MNTGFMVASRLDVISVCWGGGINFTADFLNAVNFYCASLRPEHFPTGSVYIFLLQGFL